MSNPRISVIIPVKNEARHLSACLDGILAQSVSVEEILVIDSGSTDGSQDIACSRAKVRVIEIPPESFNHGATRNLGVAEAVGELILFTVGDARPVDRDWIAKLLYGMTDDDVAGVCGAQIVADSPETNPIECCRPLSEPRLTEVWYESAKAFDAAPAEEKRISCAWDNVTALYQRRVLIEIPFTPTVYGEDPLWARDALRHGYRLTYAPAARVYHFHINNYATTLKHTISVCYMRYALFGVLPEPFNLAYELLRRNVQLLRNGEVPWKSKPYWVHYNIRSVFALFHAVKMFRQAVHLGPEAVNNLHEQYSGTPPIPLKQGLA